MPSMLTTFTEKIDTSPIIVAPTSTASDMMTPLNATSNGIPAAMRPPNSSTITNTAIGRAMASPRSRSFSEAVSNCSPTSRLPPTSTLGRVDLSGDVGDVVREFEFGLLLEVAGEGDDRECGSAVAGAELVAAGAPVVGDIDDAVGGTDAIEGADDVGRHLGVVDVDAVDDDGDLAARRGECVEAFGDLPALGRTAGTEVRRQHREGGTANRSAGEQYQQPHDHDGPPAADHERCKALHHATARIDDAEEIEPAGVARTASTSPPSTAQTTAPEAPKLAYCASTSLITCAVMNQPSAHRAGVTSAHARRRTLLPGSTSAWAIPMPAPVSAPIATRFAVSVSKPTAEAPATSPAAIPTAVAPAHASRRVPDTRSASDCTPPRTTPAARPPTTAAARCRSVR